MNFFQNEVNISNSIISLRPMIVSDNDNFKDFIQDTKIWQYVTYKMQNQQDIDDYVTQAVLQRKLASCYHFVIQDIKTGEVLGYSALCNYSAKDHRIEIVGVF